MSALLHLPLSIVGVSAVMQSLAGRWRRCTGVTRPVALVVITGILVSASLCSWAPAEEAPAPLKLNGATASYDLRGHLAIYEDKAGEEAFDSVRSKTFHAIAQAVPSFGYTRSAYWIKLALENETAGPLSVLLDITNHYLDFVDIFVASPGKDRVVRYRSGARVPFGEKISGGRHAVVSLRFEPHARKDIFVRARSETPLRVPLSISSEEAYRGFEHEEYLLQGVFYGILLFLIFYNLFAWSILKQRAYLYYILTVVSVGLNQCGNDGLVPRVAVFSQPETMLHLLTGAIGFTFVFNTVFVSSFMDARAKYPVLYRILDILLILGAVSAVLYLANYYVGNKVAMAYGPILAWAFAIIIGLMWYWGESQARYLFLAHVQFPILAIVYVSTMIGLIPFNSVLAQSLKFAYLLQGMFFSLALADRYSLMQRRFRHILEHQVSVRSTELLAANKSLKREIVERKRAEEAMAKAKQAWEQTFDSVPDLVAIIDENHVIQRVNKTMADKVHAHPRDLVGLHCYELCHGTEHPLPSCPLNRSLSDNTEHYGEITEPRLGGTFFVTVSPLQTDPGALRTFVHVARDITDRKVFEEQLRNLAMTDSLTSAWNRRHFVHLTERELDRTRRYGGHLAVLMLDLDHFKAINDTYGHDVGDDALKRVAEVGRTTLRKVDIFARYGGEEFVVALPDTNLEQAVEVAERLRESVGAIPMPKHNPPLQMTVSIGVAASGQNGTDLSNLLKQADKALYQAKNNGRNRVKAFQQSDRN